MGASALGLVYLTKRQTTELNQIATTSVTAGELKTSTLPESSLTSEIGCATIRAPAQGCYLGAYIGDFPDLVHVDDFENMIGRKLAIISLFYPWEDQGPFPRDALENYTEHGTLPMISWKPVLWDPINKREVPAITLQDIIDHKHDSYIERWAGDARSFCHPFFLRFACEMNGDWDKHCGPNNFGPSGDKKWNEVDDLYKYYGDPKRPDGPERYIDAWRHVHDVFERVGAHNVIWVWSPNCENWPDMEWNGSEIYYPGDEYVDWVGVSLYNQGYVDGKASWQWRSFDALFSEAEPIKVYQDHRNKPFMLAEYCSAENDNPSATVSKSEWIREAFHDMKTKYTAIKAAAWFSFDKRASGGNQEDWRINSSQESLEAYKESVSDQYFLDRVVLEP